MAKLTKAQRAAIGSAIRSIQAAIDDIMRPSVAICHKSRVNVECVHTHEEYRKPASSAVREHFRGRDGTTWSIDYVETLEETAKHSRHFVQAFDAVRTLNAFLDE